MAGWLVSELNALSRAGGRPTYALDLSTERVALLRRKGAQRETIDAVDLDADDFSLKLDEMRRRVARRDGAAAEVELLLPEALTLMRVETFPAAAQRSILAETRARLEAMTPYRADELCFDVAVIGKVARGQPFEVHIAVAPQEIVDEAIDYAERWGFTPTRVSASGRQAGFPHGPEFERLGGERGSARPFRRAAAAMAVIALLLGVIGGVRGLAERGGLAAEAEARAEAAEGALVEALAVKTDALALARTANHPSAQRAARRFAVDVMEAVAAAMPPGARADRVLFSPRSLRIEGRAPSVDAVIAGLEGLDALSGARLAAPATRGADGLWRFAIEAEVTPPPVREEEPKA